MRWYLILKYSRISCSLDRIDDDTFSGLKILKEKKVEELLK